MLSIQVVPRRRAEDLRGVVTGAEEQGAQDVDGQVDQSQEPVRGRAGT